MRFPVKATKYRAVRTEYAGLNYASKSEAKRAHILDMLMLTGDVYWWIRQPTFHLGCPENKYVADFLVVGKTGVWVEDCKGLPSSGGTFGSGSPMVPVCFVSSRGSILKPSSQSTWSNHDRRSRDDGGCAYCVGSSL